MSSPALAATRLTVALFTVALATTPLVAQPTATPVAAGQRIRLASSTLDGRFVVSRLTADSLYVVAPDSAAAPLGISLASIRRLDVSGGRRTRREGFRRGAAVGAFVGALVVFSSQRHTDDPSFGPDFEGAPRDVAEFAALTVGGGLLGLALRGERWARVSLTQLRASASSDTRRLTVGISSRF